MIIGICVLIMLYIVTLIMELERKPDSFQYWKDMSEKCFDEFYYIDPDVITIYVKSFEHIPSKVQIKDDIMYVSIGNDISLKYLYNQIPIQLHLNRFMKAVSYLTIPMKLYIGYFTNNYKVNTKSVIQLNNCGDYYDVIINELYMFNLTDEEFIDNINQLLDMDSMSCYLTNSKTPYVPSDYVKIPEVGFDYYIRCKM